MVSPAADAAAPDELSAPLEVSQDALVERLQRRVAALERQLEARIAQVADLHARLAHEQQNHPDPAVEADLRARLAHEQQNHADPAVDADLRQRAAQYDALMATVTMRALRLPRAWYAELRRRLLR